VNTILDGTDNRDFLYGNMLIVPNLDSIAETKVTTSSYDAEFGQVSAALVTVSTKSGTDKWHGSGFFYRRSDAYFARDPFAQSDANRDPVTGRFIPPTLWGQFGGSIGGAIIKNKLFVFGDYQGTRAHDGGSAQAEVPTAAERSGDFSRWAPSPTTPIIFNPFSGCPGGPGCVGNIQDNLALRTPLSYNGKLNVIDPTLISSAATALLNYVPLPLAQEANNPIGTLNYAGSGDEIYHADALDVRADYFYSDKLRLFDRYTFTQFHKEAPGLFGGAAGGPQLNPIGYTGVGDTRPQSNSFGVSYAIKPNLLMDVRFGWYKQRINVNPLVTGDFATQAGAIGLNIPGDPTTNSMPHFNIQEGGGPGLDFGNGLYDNCNCPLVERMQQFQEIGNLTWTMGKHTFKFGPDFHYNQNLRLPSDEHRSGEVYTTNLLTEGSTGGGLGMAAFLLGGVSQFQRYISHVNDAGERQWRFFFYGQDTWRVTPKLTLTYGLRWEIYRPQKVTGKDDGGWFNLANGEIDVAGENGVPLSGPVVTNLKNFAPRAGIAYQVNPKTVVRMGYGRSFDVGMFGTIFGHTVTQNLPVLGTQQINPLPNPWDGAFQLATGPPLLDPATALNNQPVGPDGNHIYPDGFRAWVDPFHTRMPTVDSWNATIQRQITPTLSLQAGYVGNKGSHIFVGENNWINLNTPTEVGFGILSQSERLPFCGNSNPTCGPNSNAPNNFGLTTGLQCMCNPGDNHYNSLQMQLDKRFSHGLNILGNYTYSHAKNHDSPDFLYAPALEYGRPSWQRNQNITVSTIYELPFGKGKALAGNSPSVVNYLIGGWQLVNVTTIMSGSGVNPSYNGNSGSECSFDNDAGVCFPNVAGSWHVSHPNRNQWFAQTALVPGPGGVLIPTQLATNGLTSGPWQRPVAPVPGLPSFGNAQRNSIIGPKWFDSDLSVVKIVPVGEQLKIQFRAEAFNVFNHPNLGNPNGCVDCSGGATIQSLANNAIMRRLQLGLRFDF
jgi:outer membrane receptor protein involved in Fe transport